MNKYEYTHADYVAMLPFWRRMRDVLAGQDAIKARSTAYLPLLNGQTPNGSEYQAYLSRATFYNATAKTHSAILGMTTRKYPSVEVPDAVKLYLDDIDLNGNSVLHFATEVIREKSAIGQAGILVDYPTNPTPANPQASRPYLTLFTGEQIINWHATARGELDLIVLRTSVQEDKYGVEPPRLRYTVLELEEGVYTVTVYEDGDIVSRATPRMNGRPMNFIPFYFCNTSLIPDKPPLLDLANLNLSHYTLYADFRHLLHYASIPTLVISGVGAEFPPQYDSNGNPVQPSLAIGSEKAMVFRSEMVKAEWIKCGSDGAEPIRKELDDLENRMASLGAAILQDRVDRETALAADIRNSENTATVVNIVREVSQAMTKALRAFTRWCGEDDTDVNFKLSTDFNIQLLGAAEIQTVVQAWQAGAISMDTMLYIFERGELLPEFRTVEEEKALIEQSAPPVVPGATPAIGAPLPETTTNTTLGKPRGTGG